MADKNDGDTKQEITPPAWMNVQMLQEALRRGGEGNVLVKEFTVGPVCAPGNNYGSELYRAKITLADGGQRSLIVKGLPPGEVMAAAIVESGTFQREICTLTEAVPRMQALLEEVAPKQFPQIAPRVLHTSSGSDLFIVMEDLAAQDFRLANRQRGLGLRHSLLAVRSLANFHAASVALLQKDPTLAQQFDNPWRNFNAGFKFFMESGIQSVADIFNNSPGYEEYGRWLEDFKPKALDEFTKFQDPKPGAFNVLVHGDFWVNNMMFRYENGEPRTVRLVDLQITHVASPAMDLLYFLSSSLSEGVSEHYEDLLIREYHAALTKAMDLLGLQAPSLDALHADMAANGPAVLFGATCALPGIKQHEVLDFDATMIGDSSGTDFIYKNPLVKKWLLRLFPEFKRRGWLHGL